MALRQRVQRRLHLLRAAAQQLAGGGEQLVPGQKHMAVVLVIGQLKGHSRFQPLTAVLRKAHGQRHGVRHGKVHAAHVVRQQIGIPPHHFQRPVPVLLPQPDGQHRRQLIPGQELHQPPQSHVLAEQRPDLHGLFRGDAPDHPEAAPAPLPECPAFPARSGPRCAGQWWGRRPCRCRRTDSRRSRLPPPAGSAPVPPHLQLLAVLGVGLPSAGDGQMLPRRHAGDAPHNGDDLPLLGEKAEDRIPVFRVLKNDAMYRALPADQFFHGLPLSILSCSFQPEVRPVCHGGILLPGRQIIGKALGPPPSGRSRR